MYSYDYVVVFINYTIYNYFIICNIVDPLCRYFFSSALHSGPIVSTFFIVDEPNIFYGCTLCSGQWTPYVETCILLQNFEFYLVKSVGTH